MDKHFIYAITFVVCLLLQLGLAPAIAIGGCSPDFLLIPVLIVSLKSGPGAGSISGFVLGMIEDLAGSATVGCTALTFCIVALIVGFVGATIESGSPVVGAIVGAVSPFVAQLVYGISYALTNAASGGFSTVLSHGIPCALYTLVFTVIGLTTMCIVVGDTPRSMPGTSIPLKYK